MRLKQIVLTASLLTSLALVTAGSSAGEKHKHDHDHDHDHDHRQHGAHVHGIAALNLVLDGREVHVELASPAANIVGFEHVPSSKAERVALEQAVATLNEGDRLFRFSNDAGCRMEQVKLVSGLLEAPQQEHATKHAVDHAHEVQRHAGDTHSDIEAVYHFACDHPGRLTQLTVELFDAFPGMEKLKLQYVIQSRQGAAELTATHHVVRF